MNTQVDRDLSGYNHFLLVFFIATLLSFTANATERWRPNMGQFQTRERVKDCSVYRSVLNGDKSQLEQKQTILKEILTGIHLQFDTLEQCARAKGLLGPAGINSEELELKSAQACPAEYEAWLQDGMHLMMTEEDVKELSHQVSQLNTVIKDQCAPIIVAQNAD